MRNSFDNSNISSSTIKRYSSSSNQHRLVGRGIIRDKESRTHKDRAMDQCRGGTKRQRSERWELPVSNNRSHSMSHNISIKISISTNNRKCSKLGKWWLGQTGRQYTLYLAVVAVKWFSRKSSTPSMDPRMYWSTRKAVLSSSRDGKARFSRSHLGYFPIRSTPRTFSASSKANRCSRRC